MSRSNFDDVGDFHEKFELDNVTHQGAGPRKMPDDLMQFRLKFLLEELLEFAHGIGYRMHSASDDSGTGWWEFYKMPNGKVDHEKAFDSLLDLAYVTFGAAQVLGYPWQAGWEEVQRANITKERCRIGHRYVDGEEDRCQYGIKMERSEGGYEVVQCQMPKVAHSLRGSDRDVIKPTGWTAPDIKAVLKDAGFDLKD
jgi:predicted HAD superfamily Cof-like phosphohydrolase